MTDCDYCSAEFEDEDAYLDHLAETHEDELGAIERRRVADRDDGSGGVSGTAIVVGVVAVLAVGAVAGTFLLGGGSGGTVDMTDVEDIESASLTSGGNQTLLSAVEKGPDNGRGHVSSGTSLNYDSAIPLSGKHYPRATPPGFYEETIPMGNLVHSLEHGTIVVYYEKGTLAPETRQSLQQFVQTHRSRESGVLVVPNPNENPESKLVLAAWRHRLDMNEYEPRTVFSFIAEYYERGPEDPDR